MYITEDRWRQMVRDFEGRWGKYAGIQSTISHSPYFFGKQNYAYYQVHKDREDIVRLVKSNVKAREFLEGNSNTIASFTSYLQLLKWLNELHHIMMWKDGPNDVHSNYLQPSSGHTNIVYGDVIPLAKLYKDPYPNFTNGPFFEGIPEDGQPCDLLISETRVDHYYPHPKYFPYYLRRSLDSFKKIISNEGDLSDIAFFYQITLNMHLFEIINNSMLMAIVNYMLRKKGLKGIEHGILDFVAYRLSTKNFAKYFQEEVERIQNR